MPKFARDNAVASAGDFCEDFSSESSNRALGEAFAVRTARSSPLSLTAFLWPVCPLALFVILAFLRRFVCASRSLFVSHFGASHKRDIKHYKRNPHTALYRHGSSSVTFHPSTAMVIYFLVTPHIRTQ
eukprot:14150085-Ditylum_brightwellii.AAC.1